MHYPFFTSHYSYGRSILTLEKKGTSSETGADSIIDLALKNHIKDLYLVEDNLSSFIQAYESCQDANLNLRYGLRLTMTNDMTKKDEESLNSNHKIIIFALNTQGWYALCSIYSKAACDGKYYVPRLDYKTLKTLWNKKDLAIVIPFYDSFLYNNNLLGNKTIPDMFFDPLFLLENNNLPMDEIMLGIVTEYVLKNKYKFSNAQTIYYAKYNDFKAYQTYRCIDNRSTLDKPELEGFFSDTFCLEHYLETDELTKK